MRTVAYRENSTRVTLTTRNAGNARWKRVLSYKVPVATVRYYVLSISCISRCMHRFFCQRWEHESVTNQLLRYSLAKGGSALGHPSKCRWYQVEI